MSTPYVGEIRIFAGNFAPAGWAFCEGQLMSISENETLFQLIGTTYGGDGESTYALPDLRGRAPMHQGQGPGLSAYVLAQSGGAEQITLTVNQIPSHNHAVLGANVAATDTIPNNTLAPASSVPNIYDVGPDTSMNPAILSGVGGNQPHNNLQPSLAVNFIIALFGIFPSPN
ncbi:MAG: tail fiber protein [Anaerolineae bacterium]|jgi:microcystin-dependent protein|nr:tail fiber protein [Anaerolineae bacterium]